MLAGRLRLLGLILITGVFYGCAQSPTLEVDRELQEQLRRVEHWQAEGKLGVRLKDEGHSAYFEWQHQPETFALRLSGPFGHGTTWLRKQGRHISLESPDQPVHHASSAEHLMQSQLGWQVPVSNLSYWIRGVAAPGLKVTQVSHNPDGTLAELQQQGWHISYSRYQVVGDWAVPGKLVARRDDIRLTVIIKSWQLPQQQPAPQTAGIRAR